MMVTIVPQQSARWEIRCQAAPSSAITSSINYVYYTLIFIFLQQLLQQKLREFPLKQLLYFVI